MDVVDDAAGKVQARMGKAFRFALTSGLRCSAYSNENPTTQKGDII